MKSSHWISQKLWFETKLKKGPATRGESNPSDSVGSSSPQKPVNQWWFQKETKLATVSAGKKISGSNLLILKNWYCTWEIVFQCGIFVDAFGILRCSWCMEYLPLHWNCWRNGWLCGNGPRTLTGLMSKRWNLTTKTKTRWGKAWNLSGRDVSVNFSVCVLPWCVFLNQETEIPKNMGKRTAIGTTLPITTHQPAEKKTGWFWSFHAWTLGCYMLLGRKITCEGKNGTTCCQRCWACILMESKNMSKRILISMVYTWWIVQLFTFVY